LPYWLLLLPLSRTRCDGRARYVRRLRQDRLPASVLFTDIVDATKLAAEIGDRGWKELLGHHHRTVRQQLERHRGREIDTADDAFLAAFDGPARANRCAGATVDAAWVSGYGPVSTRASVKAVQLARQVIEAIQTREACCADRSALARAH